MFEVKQGVQELITCTGVQIVTKLQDVSQIGSEIEFSSDVQDMMYVRML